MSLLAAYYASQEQDNAAHAQLLGAQARLTSLQGNELGANSAATRDEQASRAQANRAGAARQAADTAQAGPNAQSQRQLQTAQTQDAFARAGQAPFQNAASTASTTASQQATGEGAPLGSIPPVTLSDTGGPVSSLPSFGAGPGLSFSDPQGDETGGKILTKGEAAQGKAKKPGPTDTVPAMLTPGEAVLNKGAVQHYGSDVIDHMNKMGLLRMGAQSEVAKHLGLPDPHAPPQQAGKQPADRKPNKESPKSTTPSGGRAGFATGGLVLPTFSTGPDKAAIAGQSATLDPTSYALGILHGAGVGPAVSPTKNGKRAAAAA